MSSFDIAAYVFRKFRRGYQINSCEIVLKISMCNKLRSIAVGSGRVYVRPLVFYLCNLYFHLNNF